MRLILICAVLLGVVTVTLQTSSTKEEIIKNDNKIIKGIIIEEKTIKDIWNTIKNTAKNVWESVKCIANNSKRKIKKWISDLGNRVNEITTVFEKQLKVLKERVVKFMEEIVKTSHVVKSCVKDNEKSIDETVNQILNRVTTCISGNSTKLSQIDIIQSEDFLYHENHLTVIEQELNDCLKERDAEACSYEAKMKIMVEANNTERDILRNHEYMRSILDDLLDAIVTCSVDGLINASANITSEAIKIFRCVVNE